MGTDGATQVKKGVVSSVNAENGSVRVTFEDADNNVSAELPILNRGSGGNKDYWLPDVGEQVVCIFETNDKNMSSGWVIGSYFSDQAKPPVQDKDIHRFTFSDGSYIEHNRSSHEMTIKCVGHLRIIGAKVDIN
ncbi:phage baseplate assembly protein V [Pectinatus frisingensis]|uniref:phage baseplate assembly protein V n=1 Tax=Pectinatus frisingensis TaxID=865 RepID=UPI0018C57E3C|nr:phage baseplate assembly protein V [Pectinatus frisingensis]